MINPPNPYVIYPPEHQPQNKDQKKACACLETKQTI